VLVSLIDGRREQEFTQPPQAIARTDAVAWQGGCCIDSKEAMDGRKLYPWLT
jgi:hypothetical protein